MKMTSRWLGAVLGGVLISAVTPGDRSHAADPSPGPRFEHLTVDQMSPEQKHLTDEILKMSSIGISGPYLPMLQSPPYGERLVSLLHYLRIDTSVPIRLNEFAILIVARHSSSELEWRAHVPMALKAGLSRQVIDELNSKKRPSGMKEDEAVVYDFLTEMLKTQKLSDTTFNRARKIFTEQQIVDLTGVAGTYLGVSLIVALAKEPPQPSNETLK